MQLTPGWNALFVADWSGSYVDGKGSSAELSNAEDRALFLRLRKTADAIVTTGATVRSEKYTKVSYAPIYILSASADVPDAELGTVLNFEAPIFDELTERLTADGHKTFFYEGGPRLLAHIEQTAQPATLWLTIVGERPSEAEPNSVMQALGFSSDWQLESSEQLGTNLLTRWRKR